MYCVPPTAEEETYVLKDWMPEIQKAGESSGGRIPGIYSGQYADRQSGEVNRQPACMEYTHPC